MNLKNKKILILAPHTDDGELGCGGTISRAIGEGSDVYYAAFSTADESLPDGFPKDQLVLEVRNATEKLGILEDQLFIYRHQVRKLNYVRQEILEQLVLLKNRIKPDIVFLPSSKDIHQDHITITKEGIRAFKYSTILGYELIWNNLSFNTDCFIGISENHLNQKIEALNQYITQKGRSYMDPEFIRSLAKVRGTQIGMNYAEAFEVIRLIID